MKIRHKLKSFSIYIVGRALIFFHVQLSLKLSEFRTLSKVEITLTLGFLKDTTDEKRGEGNCPHRPLTPLRQEL